jgi:hypothetical protein
MEQSLRVDYLVFAPVYAYCFRVLKSENEHGGIFLNTQWHFYYPCLLFD